MKTTQMRVLREFSRDELVNAIKIFDSSAAPRTEDLMLDLQQALKLDAQSARWLYDAIIFARSYIGEVKSIQVVDSALPLESFPQGSRRYGDYVYVIIREST